jgi:hypothetical protein
MLRGAFCAITLWLSIVSGAMEQIHPLQDGTRYLPWIVHQTDQQPAFPIRAAFYYPWFPEAWRSRDGVADSQFTPMLGYYDSSDTAVIQAHIAAMQYGGIEAGIVSWWSQEHRSDQRIATLLAATQGSTFRWALYYEKEARADPTAAALAAELHDLADQYGNEPSYLRIDGRFVVFVYADSANGEDDCEMVERWRQANTANAYVVLKVFTGYRDCPVQPDSWHQYGPARATSDQAGYSFTISPGFWKHDETAPRLERDLNRWRANIRQMIASNAPFQLITSFNEWGEGTSVEAATEWASASGYGTFLDVLHEDGTGTQIDR